MAFDPVTRTVVHINEQCDLPEVAEEVLPCGVGEEPEDFGFVFVFCDCVYVEVESVMSIEYRL